MAPKVLKSLHRRHDSPAHSCGSAGLGTQGVATASRNMISSQQPDASVATLPPAVAATEAGPSPTTPGNALVDLHQAASSSSSSAVTSPSSSSSSSPMTSPDLPPIPAKPIVHHGVSFKKLHGLHLRSRSNSRSDTTRSASTPPATPAAGAPARSQLVTATNGIPQQCSVPIIQRFPSRVELRAQYDRHGRLVRAVEEFYDHDATMPCLGYGEPSREKQKSDYTNTVGAGTPPGPVGSDAFGRPPPYV